MIFGLHNCGWSDEEGLNLELPKQLVIQLLFHRLANKLSVGQVTLGLCRDMNGPGTSDM